MNKKDAKKDWKKAIGKLFETWEALAESETPTVEKKKRPRPKRPKPISHEPGGSTGIRELHAPVVA